MLAAERFVQNPSRSHGEGGDMTLEEWPYQTSNERGLKLGSEGHKRVLKDVMPIEEVGFWYGYDMSTCPEVTIGAGYTISTVEPSPAR